jgi:hypothetical protein
MACWCELLNSNLYEIASRTKRPVANDVPSFIALGPEELFDNRHHTSKRSLNGGKSYRTPKGTITRAETLLNLPNGAAKMGTLPHTMKDDRVSVLRKLRKRLGKLKALCYKSLGCTTEKNFSR